MNDTEQLGAIVRLKNKTVGRKAISTLLVGSFTGLYFSGRVTGEGIYNKQAQNAREKTAQILRIVLWDLMVDGILIWMPLVLVMDVGLVHLLLV